MAFGQFHWFHRPCDFGVTTKSHIQSHYTHRREAHHTMAVTLTAQTVAGAKPRPAAYYISDAFISGLQLRVGTDA